MITVNMMFGTSYLIMGRECFKQVVGDVGTFGFCRQSYPRIILKTNETINVHM